MAAWLDVSARTIRLWSGEYAEYLSPQAVGGDGRARSFNELDQRILARVAALRTQNTAIEDIHADLKLLHADQWQDLPPMPPSASPDDTPIQMVPRETAERVFYEQRAALLREIEIRESRIGELTAELRQERDNAAQLQSELTAARESLGELRGQLSTLDGTAQRERRALVIGLVALAVAVAVLLAVVILLALAGGGVG